MAKKGRKSKVQAKGDGRAPSGQFVKGEYKGGPGGAREGSGRKPSEMTELHQRLFTPELAESAAQVLTDHLKAKDLDAAKYVCDRMFGKPKQAVDLSTSEPLEVVIRYVKKGPTAGA